MVGESLFLAGLAMVGLAGRQHILAFMEPKFPRLLARSGLVFQRVSDMFEICGRRAAYYLDQHQGVRKMQPGLHTLYRQINHELHEQYLRQQAIQAESH
ncbi:hypothetical protein [Kushneria phosphatilytica]|uniref:hypothetical protein n=1 Tax=Kushneria phosphatilytica TaxID=657387 RepID=UPI0008DA7A73|nr:hypothetical protein [Kushneria phosphatilytica]OHV10518.1 hypothetical protein BH688_08900 [Kushneria phosphatilytica]